MGRKACGLFSNFGWVGVTTPCQGELAGAEMDLRLVPKGVGLRSLDLVSSGEY